MGVKGDNPRKGIGTFAIFDRWRVANLLDLPCDKGENPRKGIGTRKR